MATILPVIDQLVAPGIVRTVWSNMANGDIGAISDYPGFADRNFQVSGTFGAGGEVTMQGSNEPPANDKWFTLSNMADSALVVTTAGGKMIQENTLYIRPKITGGDGTTSLTITLIARKPR